MERYSFSDQERALLEHLKQPFAVYQFVNKRVATLILSDGFCELFGYEDRATAYFDMDNNMYRDTHPDDAARIADDALRFATQGGVYDVVYRSRTQDRAGYRIIRAVGKHVTTPEGVRLAQVWYMDEGLCSDAPQANALDLNLAFSSALREFSLSKPIGYDRQTGLPDVNYFYELAEAERKELLQSGAHPALLFMDLSGMKFFNRRHGYAAGDRLLKAVAGLLAQSFGSECCCHVSGDHFAAIAPEEGIEERLRALFGGVEQLNDGNSLPIRVGVFLYLDDKMPVSAACDRAKLACDSIRAGYGSGFAYYSKDLRDALMLRQFVLENIDRALENGRIEVYYQPIIRAANGRVCDEEALARWNDPERGFLSPDDFIPFLESSGQIYKLDLYVLEQVLQKLRRLREEGLFLVPQSVNISRTDFDACDMVEQIRKRVDAAEIPRSLITVELTESTLGTNHDFMKQQVRRFRALGFAVWMDDFGSGYSSLEVLQSMQFDLIKFDRSFMLRLDESDSAKIILTELMRMATALGVDTVCEGVETEEQVRFLQEIGCSKLQGFYYCRPIPLKELLSRYRRGVQIGFENPEESAYYEAVSRVNLHDLTVLTREDEPGVFRQFFNTLPMCILELDDERAWYVRCNSSYRDFAAHYFDFTLERGAGRALVPAGGNVLIGAVRESALLGNRLVFDDRLPDGSTVRALCKQIGKNPVTGRIAVAVAVLSVASAAEGATYAEIARALAADYQNLFYVDLNTERFIEYSSPIGGDGMATERQGTNFFAAARRDAKTVLYGPDQEPFIQAFTRENVLRTLKAQSVFTLVYRQLVDGKPMYVSMKAAWMPADKTHVIIGTSIVDAQMRRTAADRALRKDHDLNARILALDASYLGLYVIDPVTGHYHEYSSTAEYESLGADKEGDDFYREGRKNAQRVLYPDDLPGFLREFEEKNVMRHVLDQGVHEQHYRLMIRGRAIPVVMRIALVRESDGTRLIAGVRRQDGQS